MSAERDAWLASDDAKLLSMCRRDCFKATGKGGQKRNKTSSAVRLTHSPTGLSAEASETRSQRQNQDAALWKLRILIALSVRAENIPAKAKIQEDMNPKNPLYPARAAIIFDILDACGFDMKAAAESLDMSASRLARVIARDPRLWAALTAARDRLGLPRLSPPS
jgi:hypothetical protein